jgi:hypothetical protein
MQGLNQAADRAARTETSTAAGRHGKSVRFGATVHIVPIAKVDASDVPLYLKLETRRVDQEDVPEHIDSTLKKRLLRRVSMFRYAEYGVLGTSALVPQLLPPIQHGVTPVFA